MPETTVKSFAEQIGVAPDKLLQQLSAAGIGDKKTGDPLSDDEKMALLSFLRTHHGGTEPAAKRITLTQKSTSKIVQSSRFGQARAVQVEVRKKRTFVKRPAAEEQEAVPEEVIAPPAPVAEEVLPVEGVAEVAASAVMEEAPVAAPAEAQAAVAEEPAAVPVVETPAPAAPARPAVKKEVRTEREPHVDKERDPR
ncbi:MAG: translation initiation factor IF-2 associated domain-containing protein [Gammaproteobacteria bacterium]|nr:translation initiation factor IF-2 associated domain-containing protein [Gammaproteobacteria bacterium]